MKKYITGLFVLLAILIPLTVWGWGVVTTLGGGQVDSAAPGCDTVEQEIIGGVDDEAFGTGASNLQWAGSFITDGDGVTVCKIAVELIKVGDPADGTTLSCHIYDDDADATYDPCNLVETSSTTYDPDNISTSRTFYDFTFADRALGVSTRYWVVVEVDQDMGDVSNCIKTYKSADVGEYVRYTGSADACDVWADRTDDETMNHKIYK